MKRVDFHGFREFQYDRIRVLFPAIWYVPVQIVMVHILHVQLATLSGHHGSPPLS